MTQKLINDHHLLLSQRAGRAKGVFAKAVLLFVASVVALGLAEGLSRVFLPISPGSRITTLDGEPRERLPSDGRFRQQSSEFDVVFELSDGHQVPAVTGNPELIFIGDSFTFGVGLNDEETFPHLYCTGRAIICANLGWGDTGTAEQVNRLEHYIRTRGWRPKRVYLFMLVMTRSLMAGNDFLDNLSYDQDKAVGNQPEAGHLGLREQLVTLSRPLLKYSNLLRAVYYHAGPLLRAWLSPEPEAARLQAAQAATKRHLSRLEQLSHQWRFEYEIFLLHPMQDILNATDRETLAAIQALVPDVRITDTAHLFREGAEAYYYAYDGHLNAKGSRKLAELLLSENRPDL